MMTRSLNNSWLCDGSLRCAFGMRLVFSQGADHDHQATFYAHAGGAAFRCSKTRRRARPVLSRQANPLRCAFSGGRLDRYRRSPIAENVSRAFGQQVYVENKSGGNGTIGVEDAAKSAPDGYTVIVTIDTVTSNPHVFHTNIRRACSSVAASSRPSWIGWI